MRNTVKSEQRIGISLYFQSTYTIPSFEINQKVKEKGNP